MRRYDGRALWLAAYGAATATTASFESIRDAATAGEVDKPSKATVQGYREALQRRWILDPLPAWLADLGAPASPRIGPRHHLVDPALAARLVGADAASLLAAPVAPAGSGERTLLGPFFESLVALDLRVYAQNAEARVGHLRTHGGEHEIDLIVERADRRVLAIEVKLTSTVRDQLGDRVVDLLVVTTGRDAYRRRDGVGVVPAALLGP